MYVQLFYLFGIDLKKGNMQEASKSFLNTQIHAFANLFSCTISFQPLQGPWAAGCRSFHNRKFFPVGKQNNIPHSIG